MATQTRAGATPWRLEVSAGPRPRARATVAVEAAVPDGGYRLCGDGGELPAQVDGGWLLAVVPYLARGERRGYTLRPAGDPAAAVAQRQGGAISVRVGGTPLGDLLLAGATKPYLYPVLLPDGTSVVRRVPPDPEAGDVKDHPHHRGLWAGHGDCNGVDCWSDAPGRLGRGAVRSVECRSGPVAADVVLQIDWTGPGDEPAFHERRNYRFWNVGAGARTIDVTSAYRGAGGGELRFGDTKEGALCCIRLAGGMEGERGGLISTAEGACTEAEAWGSAAGWCDYSGRPFDTDGRGRRPEVGVAIFDHPGNPLYPTRWHVRDYGLMTANPFALHDYMPRSGLRGDYVVPAGATATFRYRVYAHNGGAAEADVAGRFADWAWPVGAKVAEG